MVDASPPRNQNRPDLVNHDHGGYFEVDGWCNGCGAKFDNHQRMLLIMTLGIGAGIPIADVNTRVEEKLASTLIGGTRTIVV